MIWNFLQPLLGKPLEKLIDKIPDVNERARLKADFEKEMMGAVMSAAAQQNRVNELEAQHKSVFVAGWRPFIGWVCGVAIAYTYLIQPAVQWYVAIKYPGIVLPTIATHELYGLVLGMLGMGGLRTYEKMKGVSRETRIK